jgi:hypothetical protein
MGQYNMELGKRFPVAHESVVFPYADTIGNKMTAKPWIKNSSML